MSNVEPLKVEEDPRKTALNKLRNLYTPAALEFLYQVMMMEDKAIDFEYRMKAAEILATTASIPVDDEDDY